MQIHKRQIAITCIFHTIEKTSPKLDNYEDAPIFCHARCRDEPYVTSPCKNVYGANVAKKSSTQRLQTNSMTKKYCLEEEGKDGQRGRSLHSPLLLPICAKCDPYCNLWKLDTNTPVNATNGQGDHSAVGTHLRHHMIAAHMGQGAPKDLLVTFVIGAGDRQCHKTPIVTIVVGNKRLRKVVHCSDTGGLPTWKKFWLLQPVSNHPQKDNPTGSPVGSH